MGNFTWEGWQTSAEDAPQPTSILCGKNLKTDHTSDDRQSSVADAPQLTSKGESANRSIPEHFRTIDPSSVEAKIAQELCDSLNVTVLEREEESTRDTSKSEETE